MYWFFNDAIKRLINKFSQDHIIFYLKIEMEYVYFFLMSLKHLLGLFLLNTKTIFFFKKIPYTLIIMNKKLLDQSSPLKSVQFVGLPGQQMFRA